MLLLLLGFGALLQCYSKLQGSTDLALIAVGHAPLALADQAIPVSHATVVV